MHSLLSSFILSSFIHLEPRTEVYPARVPYFIKWSGNFCIDNSWRRVFHNSPLVTLFFFTRSSNNANTHINDLSTTIEILSPNRFFQIDWPFPCPMFFAGLDQLNWERERDKKNKEKERDPKTSQMFLESAWWNSTCCLGKPYLR